MKKAATVLTVAMMCLCMVCMFTACGASGAANSEPNVNTAKMNKKYIWDRDIRKDSDSAWWYMLKDDNTGIFHRGDEYEIVFKYTYLDAEKSTAMCFFHESDDYSGLWKATLILSEDVIIESSNGNNVYICEDYLPQIPNYNKTQEA